METKKKNWDELISSFEGYTQEGINFGRKEEAKIQIKQARKIAFTKLLEMFGTWEEHGDCVPQLVPVGYNTGVFFKCEVIKSKEEN